MLSGSECPHAAFKFMHIGCALSDCIDTPDICYTCLMQPRVKECVQCVNKCVCVRTCMCVCARVYVCMYVYAYVEKIYANVCMHMHMLVCFCMNTTQTHAHVRL